MRHMVCACALLLAATVAHGQAPTATPPAPETPIQVTFNSTDSAKTAPLPAPAPVDTLKPKPVVAAPAKLNRHQRKTAEYAAGLDSLVGSRTFAFIPVSMEGMSEGDQQSIYNGLFFVTILGERAAVHVPVIRGHKIEYIEIASFENGSVTNYQASKIPTGWNISYNIYDGPSAYLVNAALSTTTGQCLLNLITQNNTMSYLGTIRPVIPTEY